MNATPPGGAQGGASRAQAPARLSAGIEPASHPGPPAPGRGRLAMPGVARTATRNQRLGLALGVLFAVLFAIWLFSPILTPFVLAACIAYFLDPATSQLERLGVRRGIAAMTMVLALALAALLALLLLYPLLISQIGVLLQRLPGYVLRVGQATRDALEALAEHVGPDVLDSRLQELAVGQAGAIVSFLGTAVARVLGGGIALFYVFTLVTVTPVVAFYLLRDWPAMTRQVDLWLPRRSAATLRQLGRDMDRVLSAWLRGQLICCAILAVYYAAALSAVGLELGLTIGLMAGILSFIPYVGSITGMLTAVLLALAQFGTWGAMATVLAVFVTGQVIEGYIIYPRLLGNRVELHAVWVIFALFAGGVVFGFLGVLLAVPIAAAVGVIARYWLRRYLESPLYLDPPRTG